MGFIELQHHDINQIKIICVQDAFVTFYQKHREENMSYAIFKEGKPTICHDTSTTDEQRNRSHSGKCLQIIFLILFFLCTTLAWAEHSFVHEITVDQSQPAVYLVNSHSIGQAIYWAFNNDIGNTIVRIAAGEYSSFAASPLNKPNRVVKIVGTMDSGQHQTIVTGYGSHQALIHIRDSQQRPGSTLIIEDICIQGGPGGIRIFDDTQMNMEVNINNCFFKENSGKTLASGLYFYRLHSNQGTFTRKMLLMK